ncbi:MAG TPA: C-type lectin domain-containing protein [Kofleriaceae bacterium]|jgi:hypothetical protein|nr:C-type lectin domain-containing protein [Kofleriaceae bacterium]
MRRIALCLVVAALAGAGCLRNTEFTCRFDADCGTMGVCESVGYCSVPNAACASTGRSFSDSAGQGLSNTCVVTGHPGLDAGVDAPMIDAPTAGGCPGGYAAVNQSPHLYKRLPAVSWTTARDDCKQTSTSAYLAVPDDAAELANLATAAMATPFWVGIDDQANQGMFVTQKGAPATFLPWVGGLPDTTGQMDCVEAVSMTQIATEKCNMPRTAVCECEP